SFFLHAPKIRNMRDDIPQKQHYICDKRENEAMESLFKIYKVDKNEALRIEQEVNNPHQHDFEELIVGLKGQLTHFIDYQIQTIDAPFVSFVTKGKTHRVEPK